METHTSSLTAAPLSQFLQRLQGSSLLSHIQDASPNRTHIRCFDVCVLVIAVARVYICVNVFMYVCLSVFVCGIICLPLKANLSSKQNISHFADKFLLSTTTVDFTFKKVLFGFCLLQIYKY